MTSSQQVSKARNRDRSTMVMFVGVFVAVLGLLCLPVSLIAQPIDAAASAPRIYRLTSDASYRNACFDPCDCVTDIRGRLAGTMELTPTPSVTPGERRWIVSDVNWKIVLADGSEWLARGRGTYSLYPTLGMLTVISQRLTLDLSINGAPPQRFDSEQVIGGSWTSLPPIDVVIDKNNQLCTDEVLRVAAAPVPASDVTWYCLGTDSSSVEGCFDPCLCPIRVEGAVAGSFGLVRLPLPPMYPTNWGDFSVVRVRWSIFPPNSPVVPTRVTGSGFYVIQQPSLIEGFKQMRLALVKGNEPERVWHAGGSFFQPIRLPPARIEENLSLNGFFCFDEAFYLRSVLCGPRPLPMPAPADSGTPAAVAGEADDRSAR